MRLKMGEPDQFLLFIIGGGILHSEEHWINLTQISQISTIDVSACRHCAFVERAQTHTPYHPTTAEKIIRS